MTERIILAVGIVLAKIAITMSGASIGVSELSCGGMALTKKLYGLLKEEAGNCGNVFFSPASLQIALALVYAGAKGSTAKEIASCLSLPESREKSGEAVSSCMTRLMSGSTDVILSIANGLFVKKEFQVKSTYLEAAKKYFSSLISAVDFESGEAVKTINDFVSKETRGKITELFQQESFDSLTRVVLVNAIYFKGNWSSQFKPEDTVKGDFHLNEKDTVKVDFMTQTSHFNVGFHSELDASVIVLPYKGDKLSMVLLVPNAIEGLKKVEDKLPDLDLVSIVKETHQEEIVLKMPKFKIEKTMQLTDILKRLGMAEMFSDRADLSGITDEPMVVDEVVQKSYIEVNEEGSEAAAATERREEETTRHGELEEGTIPDPEIGVSMMLRRMPLPPRPLDVDSPFAFFIYDEHSEIVLFAGCISKP